MLNLGLQRLQITQYCPFQKFSRFLASSLPRFLASSLPRFLASSLPRFLHWVSSIHLFRTSSIFALGSVVPWLPLTSLPLSYASFILYFLDFCPWLSCFLAPSLPRSLSLARLTCLALSLDPLLRGSPFTSLPLSNASPISHFLAFYPWLSSSLAHPLSRSFSLTLHISRTFSSFVLVSIISSLFLLAVSVLFVHFILHIRSLLNFPLKHWSINYCKCL